MGNNKMNTRSKTKKDLLFVIKLVTEPDWMYKVLIGLLFSCIILVGFSAWSIYINNSSEIWERLLYLGLVIISAIVPTVIIYAIESIKERRNRRKLLPTKIKNPPTSFLSQIAGLLPKKHRQSLLQEISDMRLEYYEALSEKKIWRARFIVAFYYIGFGWSVVMWISDKAKEVVGIIPKQN